MTSSSNNPADKHLEDFLKQCTDKNIGSLSKTEILFDKLWKDQIEKLNKRKKYLDDSIEITPIPIFVCKATIRNKDESSNESKKVFLNICSHHLIPKPTIMDTQNINVDSQNGIRFPMSCGQNIKVNNISTYDVVFHPDITNLAMSNKDYKLNICITAAQNISQKENVIIDAPFKFPKSIYKGLCHNNNKSTPIVPKQRIRKNGAAKFVQEIEDMKTSRYESVKQVKTTDNLKIKLNYTFNIVFVDNNSSKLVIDNIDELKDYFNNNYDDKQKILNKIKCIQIIVNITDIKNKNELDLDTNKNKINLKYQEKVLLSVKWNNIYHQLSELLNHTKVSAKYIKKNKHLKITCPFV